MGTWASALDAGKTTRARAIVRKACAAVGRFMGVPLGMIVSGVGAFIGQQESVRSHTTSTNQCKSDSRRTNPGRPRTGDVSPGAMHGPAYLSAMAKGGGSVWKSNPPGAAR